MTKQEAGVSDPYERRALLLHLGDVLETMYCVSQCADDYASIGAAMRGNEALAGFTWLAFIDENMTPRELIRRASGTFFVWPKALLDAELNREMLASTVKHDLFDNNAKGWRAYLAERRKDVPWFGEHIDDAPKKAAPVHVTDEAKEADARSRTGWPWPDKSADA